MEREGGGQLGVEACKPRVVFAELSREAQVVGDALCPDVEPVATNSAPGLSDDGAGLEAPVGRAEWARSAQFQELEAEVRRRLPRHLDSLDGTKRHFAQGRRSTTARWPRGLPDPREGRCRATR